MDTKRRRISSSLACLAASSISQRSLVQILAGLGEAQQSLSNLQRETDKALQIETPYGPLIQHIGLPLQKGKDHEFYFAHPFALLNYMCEKSPRYARLLSLCSLKRPAGLILYFDETSAGNVLHPDLPRETMCCYFTFKELPPWLRARKWGWIPIGFLKTTVLETVLGGMSRFTSLVVQLFFGQFFNLAITGIKLPNMHNAVGTFKAEICFFLQDEKAHKMCFDLKGAGGTKCCRACKNVLRCEVEKVPRCGRFFHISVARPHNFDSHTAESYAEMAQLLAAQHSVMKKDDFDDLQQVLGLVYNPLGLLWDSNKAVRDMCNPADVIHEDAQHSLLGSGGTAPLEVNALLVALSKQGIKPAAVDSCILDVVWPRGLRKCLKSDFFSSRIVWPKKGNLWPAFKGFASEMLAAMQVLMYFLEVKLTDPCVCEALYQHIGCFKMLFCIVSLLFSEGVSKHGSMLMNLAIKHHDLTLEVYGLVLASKPKMHQLYHIIQWTVKNGQLFTCFAPERFHKVCKSYGKNVNGPALGKHILKRVLLNLLAEVETETFAKECELQRPKAAPEMDDVFQVLLPQMGTVKCSSTCLTRHGWLYSKDLVRAVVGGQPVVGFFELGVTGYNREFLCSRISFCH